MPITGFSNSIVSAAMEFKREGLILGMGCKMFTIAGPVLVYGILSGFLGGLVKGVPPRLFSLGVMAVKRRTGDDCFWLSAPYHRGLHPSSAPGKGRGRWPPLLTP